MYAVLFMPSNDFVSTCVCEFIWEFTCLSGIYITLLKLPYSQLSHSEWVHTYWPIKFKSFSVTLNVCNRKSNWITHHVYLTWHDMVLVVYRAHTYKTRLIHWQLNVSIRSFREKCNLARWRAYFLKVNLFVYSWINNSNAISIPRYIHYYGHVSVCLCTFGLVF